MKTYHEKQSTVAAGSAQHIRQQETVIQREIREIAGVTLANAEGLTDADRQFLKDLRRDDRYSWKGLTRLMALTARCKTEAHRLKFVELLNAFLRASRPTPALSLEEAIEQETIAQADCDVAEMDAIRRPNDEAALRHVEAAALSHRSAIDLVLAAAQTRRLRIAGIA
jgi:hypothetical protein